MNPTIQVIATICLVLFIAACAWIAFKGKPEERKLGWVGLAFAVFAIFVNGVFKAEKALFLTTF